MASSDSTSHPPAPLPFTSARLIHRSPRESDGAAYAAMLSNPLVVEFEPEKNPVAPTEEDQKKKNAANGAANASGTKALTTIVLKNDDGSEGPVIGMGGFPFLPHNAEGRAGNTGALINSPYWRKGYATEAIIASLDFGFDVLGFEVIEQTTQAINTGYNGVMNSMGFGPYGERRYSEEMGFWEMNYPVTKQQWLEIKTALLAEQQNK